MNNKHSAKSENEIKLNEERFAILSMSFLVNTFQDISQNQASPSVIRNFLLQACIAKLLKKAIPTEIEDFIYSCAYKIALGEDANIAFLLKHNHRNKNTREDEMRIALDTWKLTRFDKQKRIVACLEVAQKYNLKSDTIKYIYKKHRKSIDQAYAELKKLPKSNTYGG